MTDPVLQQVNLQTLVSSMQQSVQAQNLIATDIVALSETTSAGFSVLTAAFNTAFPPPVTGSSAWTPGGIANGASVAISFAVTGAVLGKFVKSSLAADLKGCFLAGYVASANTVEAVIGNMTGATVTFTATTVNVSVGS